MTVTEILRQRLQAMMADETLYRIAKDSGISWSTLNRFRNGEGLLRGEQIDKLAEYLNMTLVDAKKSKGK